MFHILGLNKNEFDLVYSDSSSSNYGGGYFCTVSHYQTVVPDRYILSRTDYGPYYGYYGYGDNS